MKNKIEKKKIIRIEIYEDNKLTGSIQLCSNKGFTNKIRDWLERQNIMELEI